MKAAVWLLFFLFFGLIAVQSLLSPSVLIDEERARVHPPAQRLIMDSQNLANYLLIDESVRHVVACDGYSYEVSISGLLGHVYPELYTHKIATSLFPFDAEKILTYHSDAVITWSEVSEQLRTVGMVQTENMRYDKENRMESEMENWRMMGRVADKEQRANALVDRYRLRFKDITDELPRTDGYSPRIVILVNNVGAGIWMPDNDYYLMYIVKAAGAHNAIKRFFRGLFDMEQIIKADPDIILINSVPGDNYYPENLYAQPEWQTLRAVRERKVYKMPIWSYMGGPVEDALLLQWFAEVFYPDSFPHQVRQKYRDDYLEAYHYRLSDAEIDSALFVQENKQSLHYDRFQ
jgi:iron complex transport system substrate-binding protein